MSEQTTENGKQPKPKITCALTGKELSKNNVVNLATVMPSLVERIRKDYPDLKEDAFVSREGSTAIARST